jgi:hypothetical protein
MLVVKWSHVVALWTWSSTVFEPLTSKLFLHVFRVPLKLTSLHICSMSAHTSDWPSTAKYSFPDSDCELSILFCGAVISNARIEVFQMQYLVILYLVEALIFYSRLSWPKIHLTHSGFNMKQIRNSYCKGKRIQTPDHDQGPLPKEGWRGITVSANSPIDYENSNDFPIPSPTDNVSGSPDLVKVTRNSPLLYPEPRQFWSKLFLQANLRSSRRWLHLIDSTWIFVVAIPDLSDHH